MEIDNGMAARVRLALRDTSALPWLPGIAADLADAAWRTLGNDLGLTRSSYGTTRVLRGEPGEARTVAMLLEIAVPKEANSVAIAVELLPEDLARHCAGPEVRFFVPEEILGTHVSDFVVEALGILGGVPTLLPTVCSLIAALHLIDSQDDEIDISFSEPGLPFSAFVSVPGPHAVVGALRVAEAILHEAMHLQLTLAEAIVPLLKAPSGKKFYSPWRNEYRTAQGVLHALYVFRVIDTFLGSACFEGPALALMRSHAGERRATIARQIGEIRDFRKCADLTVDGVTFVDRLLR